MISGALLARAIASTSRIQPYLRRAFMSLSLRASALGDRPVRARACASGGDAVKTNVLRRLGRRQRPCLLAADGLDRVSMRPAITTSRYSFLGSSSNDSMGDSAGGTGGIPDGWHRAAG